MAATEAKGSLTLTAPSTFFFVVCRVRRMLYSFRQLTSEKQGSHGQF
jgi:hypothetical protein